MRALPRRRAATRPGMTLLEVLLALAIFLLAIVAIAGLVDYGVERGIAASMESSGTRLALSKLAEAEAGAISLQAGESGTFPTEPEWNYQVDCSPAGPLNVYAVTVTCWRIYTGRRYEVTLAQMICDPAQMGTAATASAPETTP